MNIKNFIFPTFEEWQNKYNEYESILGVYKVEISSFASYSDGILYLFTVALKNTIYNGKFFQRSFKYNKSQMDVNDLKEWYQNTIIEFNNWWKEYIYASYFETNKGFVITHPGHEDEYYEECSICHSKEVCSDDNFCSNCGIEFDKMKGGENIVHV